VQAAPILIVTGPSGVGKSVVSRLVAAAIDASVHVRIDDFMRFAVNGWVEPWLPEATHQNRVLGGAVVAAAMEFAQGGFTVVIDGVVLPDALAELAQAFRHRHVPLHYAVLRCNLDTCFERATLRDSAERPDAEGFARLHARFETAGDRQRHAVEAVGSPEEVAAAVLAAFRAGALAAHSDARP
jgi:predicted kinase